MPCLIFDHEGAASIEHVFPDAIGGALELDGICENCNSYLGTAVDSALTDHFLILIKRYKLGIRNRTGVLPNPLAGDVRDEAGHLTRFETDKKGNPIGFKYLPHVVEEKDGKVEIRVDKQDSHKLLDIVKTKYKRRGITPPSDDELRALIRSEESLKKVNREVRIDLIEYQRAIVKIGYELGLHWLDKRYVSDPIAVQTRSFLFDERDVHVIGTEYKIEGVISLEPPDDAPWDEVWRPFEHLHLGMLFATDKQVFCAIRIFNVVWATIVISNQGAAYWGGTWPKLIVLDAVARSYKEHFGEEAICQAIVDAKQYHANANFP